MTIKGIWAAKIQDVAGVGRRRRVTEWGGPDVNKGPGHARMFREGEHLDEGR